MIGRGCEVEIAHRPCLDWSCLPCMLPEHVFVFGARQNLNNAKKMMHALIFKQVIWYKLFHIKSFFFFLQGNNRRGFVNILSQ